MKEVQPQKKQNLAQIMGITRTVVRKPEEYDIRLREDRIGRYFKKYLNKFVFAEFSPEFMAKSKAGDLMKGVPIPLRKKDLKNFDGGEGVSMLVIAENMAWVMGCDPKFQFTQNYVDILNELYNYKIFEGMVKNGRDAAERGAMDDACVHFRAGLCMKPDYLHGMYSYARACRVMYMNSNNEEYIGRFKAESLDYFELLTETHPRFAQGYYYLGYAYLNMGLYTKADLAWQGFLRFTRNGKDRREIRGRRKQIAQPLQIESGYNDVLAGRYDEGIAKLEPFLSTQFKTWWPLHYYLGVAYLMVDRTSDAVASFHRVLTMNGSHLETMKELVNIYEAQGDRENKRKYEKKIKLIEQQIAEDQKEAQARIEKEDKILQEKEPENLEPEVIEEVAEEDAGEGIVPEKKRIVKSLGKSKDE